MKFTTPILATALLFTTTVLSIPTSASRLARRQGARALGSHPLIPSTTSGGQTNGLEEETNTTPVTYSSNWAGAVLTAPPAGTTFSAAYGTFTVPTPSGAGSAAAWVGIDGDTYQSAILQAGVDFTVTNGRVSYDAWYEWYPAYSYDFSGITISAGNVITVSIVSSSSSRGTVTITNVSTGKSVSKSLSAPSSSSHLGGQNAEWIVEDYEENGSMVEFSDFGTVTFTDSYAKAGAQTVGLDGAAVFDIRQGNTVYAESTIESDSSVQVKYV